MILNTWLQRDLSIFGRILLSKMEALSACSLAIPDNMIKSINQIIFNFIWKNRHHYIRKGDLVKSLEEGGLNAIDFDPMNGTLKLKSTFQCLQVTEHVWSNYSSWF